MPKLNFERLAQLTNKLNSKVNTTEEYLEYLKMHALLDKQLKIAKHTFSNY